MRYFHSCILRIFNQSHQKADICYQPWTRKGVTFQRYTLKSEIRNILQNEDNQFFNIFSEHKVWFVLDILIRVVWPILIINWSPISLRPIITSSMSSLIKHILPQTFKTFSCNTSVWECPLLQHHVCLFHITFFVIHVTTVHPHHTVYQHTRTIACHCIISQLYAL